MMGDENIRRRAYSPAELANYIKIRNKVLRERQEEIAKRYGVSQSYIARIEKIEELPDEVKLKVTWGTSAFQEDIRRRIPR